MLDLHAGVTVIFDDASYKGREHFGARGWRLIQRGVPCSACGLTDFYHARLGCRPVRPAASVYRPGAPVSEVVYL